MPTRVGFPGARVDPRIAAVGLCGTVDPSSRGTCLLPRGHRGECSLPGLLLPRTALEQYLVADLLVLTLPVTIDQHDRRQLQRLHKGWDGFRSVVADVSESAGLDRHDVEVLARLHADASRHGGALVLAGAGDTPAVRILRGRLAGLQVHPTAADAVAAAVAERPPVLTRTTELPATAAAARLAREFARAVEREWQLTSEVTERAVDVASELAANAVKHGTGLVELTLELDPDRVTTAVWDGAHAPPRLLPYRPGVSQTGLGLRIVQQLADCWGFRSAPGGKIVWAAIRREPDSR